MSHSGAICNKGNKKNEEKWEEKRLLTLTATTTATITTTTEKFPYGIEPGDKKKRKENRFEFKILNSKCNFSPFSYYFYCYWKLRKCYYSYSGKRLKSPTY